MSTYLINKSFKTTVTRSQRVLECAEAFGLGLEEKEFTVYDNLLIDIAQGDVIYITGQSGSGKSLMLKELVKQIAQEQPVADIGHSAMRLLFERIETPEMAPRVVMLSGKLIERNSTKRSA